MTLDLLHAYKSCDSTGGNELLRALLYLVPGNRLPGPGRSEVEKVELGGGRPGETVPNGTYPVRSPVFKLRTRRLVLRGGGLFGITACCMFCLFANRRQFGQFFLTHQKFFLCLIGKV